MIKKLILVIFVLLISNINYAQNSSIDSLKTILKNAKEPFERFDVLNELLLGLTGWKGDNVDSTYSVQMLKIAQQLKNDSLLSISYNWVGSYFYITKGDNSTALEYYFKALPFAEKDKDKRRISSIYFDLSLVYFDLKDNQSAVLNTRKGGQNLPNKTHPLYDFMLIQYQGNMAQYFIEEHQPDSTLYYVNKFKETNLRMKGGLSYNFAELTLRASAYAQNDNFKLANSNFKKALVISDSVESNISKLLFYNNYIPFLLSTNRIIEAGNQAKFLLKVGEDNDNLKLAGARFLRQVFEAKHQIDSAYYYSQLEADINAKFFSQNNVNRIQALAFNNQIRKVEDKAKEEAYQNRIRMNAFLGSIFTLIVIAIFLFRNNRLKSKSKKKIEKAYDQLKATQSQLIQSEKMASLGELTAGIAHEIQNPLNFVNNFSEVSNELIDEMNDEIDKGDFKEVKIVASDIKQNLEKINQHGKRASSIVKGMLEHSRTSKGVKILTDINVLADEYLRLSYHGLRAKDKSFNANFKADLDKTIPKVSIVSQDIGRVILNLINNAFYAVNQKGKKAPEEYKPTVIVSTRKTEKTIEIAIKDNGEGISKDLVDKIFQPFFTTKPSGKGTGLGLSLSYDIVTKGHGGQLIVSSKKGVYTEFKIILPI